MFIPDRVDITKILIENKADVTAEDDIGITPLHNVAMEEEGNSFLKIINELESLKRQKCISI